LVGVAPGIPQVCAVEFVVNIPPLHKQLVESLFTDPGNSLNLRTSGIVEIDILCDSMGSGRTFRRRFEK
jgi:hypothetical protein